MNRALLLALLSLALSACDPMASTYLVLRPMKPPVTDIERVPSKKELSEATSFIKAFLVRNGFSPQEHQSDSTPCRRWSRVSSDQTGKFDTFASVCHHEPTVEVTFSDWGRYRVSSPTSQLMATLRAQLKEANLLVLVAEEK